MDVASVGFNSMAFCSKDTIKDNVQRLPFQCFGNHGDAATEACSALLFFIDEPTALFQTLVLGVVEDVKVNFPCLSEQCAFGSQILNSRVYMADGIISTRRDKYVWQNISSDQG